MQSKKMMCQKLLARRWIISERTLEAWRISGCGPEYLKINGSRIRYTIEAIIIFEQQNMKGGQQ